MLYLSPKNSLFSRLLFLSVVLALAGCVGTSLPERHATAQGIAQQAGLQQRWIAGEPFTLAAYTAPLDKTAIDLDAMRPNYKSVPNTLTIYIEGDGFSWHGKQEPSLNPTPIDPVALRLAAKHRQIAPEDAVAYLARPCQYVPIDKGSPCTVRYWTTALTAEEVITSLDNAVTQLKSLFNADAIRLVGYSGGGGVALLIAARRHDVNSLITVAGNLDYTFFMRHHNVTALQHSIDPRTVASVLAMLPQRHLSGSDDEVVPPGLARYFVDNLPLPHCAAAHVIPGLSHTIGWENVWGDILSQEMPCRESKTPTFKTRK